MAALKPNAASKSVFYLQAMIFFIAAAAAAALVSGLSPDGKALLELKASIEDDLGHLANWAEFDSTPCHWTGVGCSSRVENEEQRVTSLSLGNMNLSGVLAPGAIAGLTALVNLSVDVNNFSGVLPAEIATLAKLQLLNISHNNFTGAFPSNISAMISLQELDAYNNNFTGPLPIGLGKLDHLRHLHLGGSFFDGSIPAEYGSMKSIRYLALSGNVLTGRIPPELGNLVQLEHLYLGYYNVYAGGIPSELGRLKNLIRLDLSFCGLNGTIPESLGNLKKLDTLFLQINSLSGTIPESLAKLGGLKSLDLSNNQLVGGIPDTLAALEKLELVSLFRNNLSGGLPSYIGDLPNLQVLYLWDNKLRGAIPQQLGGSGKLMAIDLSTNELNGSVPVNLCYGGQLEVLILRENQLTGSIPDSLGSCSSLVKVRLGDNLLTGPIPKGLFSLPSLRMLELVRNRLDGALEGGAFDAISLDTLDVSENQLHGELPAGVGNLFGLKELYVSWNRLSGPVPKTLGRLQQLLNMNLSHNLFSGRIPGEIGGCERLTMLDLSINQLRGSIPVALGKLEVLGVLNLSRNELSGSIPKELALLRGLNTADFSYNRLSGPIPKTEQLFNASSYIGNLGLCGAPFGPCSKTSASGSASAPRAALRHRNRINKNEPGLLAWLVGALFSAALLVLVVGVCCFFRKYRHYILGLLRRDPNSAKAWKLTAFQRLDFSASQVLESMNDDNIIGRGGSGTVYKGVMPSGEVVAVKRLASFTGRKGMVSNHSDHGFSAEVQTLGKIRHRNIVKLLGCCSNKETNILLYEYMPNGSLGEALHDKKGPLLDWPTRYKIALQAANGLCYLHHDCSPLIVHRDVKSNNILLNTEFQAHVADFGLAKLFQDSGKSESMSSIAGSYGYIAPEYAYTLKVNEKSDIYSFGVVLLELVTGKRPIEAEFGDGVDIVQWVRKKIQTNDGLLEVVDSRIGGENLPLHEVMLVLRVGLLCTIELPVDRPTMRDVVQMLSDVKPNKSKESTDFAELSSRAQLISV